MTDPARIPLPSLKSRRADLASPRAQLDTLHRVPLKRTFAESLRSAGFERLRARGIDVLQVNVGKRCNQTCRHCHVDAGPDRREVMSRQTLSSCLEALAKSDIPTVDITGGAPELCPDFRWFVREIRALGRHVIDRCNLTILETRPQRDLPEFLRDHEVEIVASLPHYRRLGTDRQRGDGVYEKSIRALQRLNAVGYGRGGPLRLTLVTNPVGAFLPGNQASLEKEWKRELERRYGVRFDALHTITNMPISRYLEWLITSDNLEMYMERLVQAFNPHAVAGVMCMKTLSVGWDGTLYDCDFNQMLQLELEPEAPPHIRDFDLERLETRRIRVDQHCFGCTAGAGSSCGGATTQPHAH